MAAAQLHGGHNAFQQPAPHLGTSPSPQSPQTSSHSNTSRTYNFGQMQGALADAAGLATAPLGEPADAPRPGGMGGGSSTSRQESAPVNGRWGERDDSTTCPRDGARTDPDADTGRQDAALTYGGALLREQHGEASRSNRSKSNVRQPG
jgi:hypothetical protein